MKMLSALNHSDELSFEDSEPSRADEALRFQGLGIIKGGRAPPVRIGAPSCICSNGSQVARTFGKNEMMSRTLGEMTVSKDLDDLKPFVGQWQMTPSFATNASRTRTPSLSGWPEDTF